MYSVAEADQQHDSACSAKLGKHTRVHSHVGYTHHIDSSGLDCYSGRGGDITRVLRLHISNARVTERWELDRARYRGNYSIVVGNISAPIYGAVTRTLLCTRSRHALS